MKSLNAFIEQANCYVEAAEDRRQRDMDVTFGRCMVLGAKVIQHFVPDIEERRSADQELKRSTYVGVGHGTSRKR